VKKKKTMTLIEREKYLMRKIERGETVKRLEFEIERYMYELLKHVYDLGNGDWQKGFSQLAERELEKNRQYLKENPEMDLYMALKDANEPLQLIKPDHPVHQTLIQILMEGWHVSLSTEETNKRAKKIRDNLIHKTAMQFSASDTSGSKQEDLSLVVKNKYADMWLNRGYVRLKGYNIEQWLSDMDAPAWLTAKTLQRHIRKRKQDTG
jgi:hypothetical protein